MDFYLAIAEVSLYLIKMPIEIFKLDFLTILSMQLVFKILESRKSIKIIIKLKTE